ncbi:hypothetical protein [Nannocystis pusilla]|uniref:hypothetical protein n=1 Tax=Nannocystis pusilla TaxID=889268 RepID=UPI003B7A13B0
MADEGGQDSGQAAGFTWGDLLAALIEQHGTLAAVAWKLIEQAPGDDVASIERALRRLRQRGQLDGGVWGQRLLRVFGVPASVESRVRWMGLYHSPSATCRCRCASTSCGCGTGRRCRPRARACGCTSATPAAPCERARSTMRRRI